MTKRSMGGMRGFCIGVARRVLHSRVHRRQVMFLWTLGVLTFVFVGVVPLEGWLMRRPVWFALFWLLALAGAGFVLLLAVYDLLMVRREARLGRLRMEAELRESLDRAVRDAARGQSGPPRADDGEDSAAPHGEPRHRRDPGP